MLFILLHTEICEDTEEETPSGIKPFSGATELFLSLKFINICDCFPLLALAARKFTGKFVAYF